MTGQGPFKTMANSRINRRRFLGGAAAMMAGGLLAGNVSGLTASGHNLRPVRNPCSVPMVRGERPEPKGRIVWLSAEAFAGSWDPTRHMVLANFHAEWNAFDRLFELDPVTGEFLPRLGLIYRIIPEGLQFTLRPDVRFHNGERFTAADVKYTLERYSSPDNTTGDYFPGPVEVEVVDDYSCRAITDTPLPVLNLLPIVHIHSHRDDADTLLKKHNGTGPFKFMKYEGETITYEANMDYWMGPPRLKEFIMAYAGDPSTRLAALQAGEVDVIDRVPADHIVTIEGDPNLKLVTSESTETTYLNFKVARNEFTANKLVRQAFAHCVDSKGVVEDIMSGYASIPSSLFANTIWPFGMSSDGSLLDYDLEAARKKLEEAGYPNGEGLPEFEVVGVAGFYPNMKEYMEYIAVQCKQVGLNMRLEIKETASWLDSYFAGMLDCDAIFIGWMNMSPEPDEFLLPFFRSGSPITFIDDPEIDELLRREGTATELESRAKIMREAVVPKIADLCIDIPIVRTTNMDATIAKVKNYALLPNSCFHLWDTYLEEE